MKHWIGLAGIVLLGALAVTMSEIRKVDVSAGPNALLYFVADTEQELTRMPVHFSRMPDEEEIRIGNDLAKYYRPDEKPSDETIVVEKYLLEVGWRLAAHAHRKLPYQFHYVPEKSMINAFALPGGHIYVGEGLLALMDSEDELASVIGHEIEHIDHYHCVERLQQERALRKIPLSALMTLPIAIFQAGYSKDKEMEADREGTRLAVQARYSPNGAIRMFETFQRLYNERNLRADSPQEEMVQVAEQTLEGYFRSHPLPSERIAQVNNLIASERWEPRAERDLAVRYIFLTATAHRALEAGQYERAQQLAMQSLKAEPGYGRALEVLADAQFGQANFSGAAETYRRRLALQPLDLGFAARYARALVAVDPHSGAVEFRSWASSTGTEENWILKTSLAGVSLLAGDPAPIRKTSALAMSDITQDWVPVALADLADWYYMAGDYPTALGLISAAIQQRPGHAQFTTEQAWIQIEQHTLADALQSLERGYDSPSENAERMMARAVALWQAKRQDEALNIYASAMARQPEWENPRWVKPLYSMGVAETIQEMKAERERRKAKENTR